VDDLSYALAVTGGGTFFFIAWWAFVFFVRGGVDGYRALEKFMLSKRKHKVRKLFIGNWR
jgi:hypothetical protein